LHCSKVNLEKVACHPSHITTSWYAKAVLDDKALLLLNPLSILDAFAAAPLKLSTKSVGQNILKYDTAFHQPNLSNK
jgi:hypothetical protein